MNPSVKASLLALVVSAALAPVNGHAFEMTQIIGSSSMAHCQAYTPGVTNTITNRVIGSENSGSKSIGIACAFEVDAAAMTDAGVQSVLVNFNNHGAAGFDIPCTLAVGPEGDFSYYISKTTNVVPSQQASVFFSPEDAESEDLGFGDSLVGLTCMMPPKAIMNDTYVSYAVDNGIPD
jgi:hypothetical protein